MLGSLIVLAIWVSLISGDNSPGSGLAHVSADSDSRMEAASGDNRETEDSSGKASCFLVVNCDMASGQICFDVIPEPESPYQIVYDVEVHDDTTVYVNLFLPYTWPKRDFRTPHFIPFRDVFQIYLIDGIDTARYRVICPRDSALIEVEPVIEKNFVRPVRVSHLPDDVVVIQVEGHDDPSVAQVKRLFVQVALDTVLATGYYHGIPRQIRAVKRGAERFNETATGRLVAMKLVRPFHTDMLSDIKIELEQYQLKWYQALPDEGDSQTR
ncbi:MAG: hypothetical protein JSU74_08340 [Candidatus Zixiibacteriota bacterium]|nr:MAG: hypothetical protein JSU74_08340 [candidate division Zixibacteria bacterium]